jgi:hypothetical protein
VTEMPVRVYDVNEDGELVVESMRELVPDDQKEDEDEQGE